MSKRKIFIVLFLFLLCSSMFSDGILIPTEAIIEENPFVLLEHNVQITIQDLIATVEINEVFWNDSQYTQRVIYLFPIPNKAIISDFKMKIGNTYYTGELMEKEQAREAFVELVKQNKNPALLEYMDANYYRIEVPSFKAHEERAVSLTYTQELEKVNGLVSLDYPLEIETLLKEAIRKINISGTIQSPNAEIFFVDSGTNEIEKTISTDKHSATLSFTREDYSPNSDFNLKFGLGENEVEAYMSTDTPDLGYNTFLLEIHPDVDYDDYQPKDVVFVLDKSGSMSGMKYLQAKKAAEFIISRLYEEDRFNLILFNHEIEAFQYYFNLFEADKKKEAIYWIYSSSAGGNTNIYVSLDMALRVFHNAENLRNPILVFLTDGIPTEGITDPKAIVQHVNEFSQDINGLRVFSFGVGYDVNTYILDLLSTNNNGQTFYVTEDESIETEVARLFSNISKPVLSDVKVEFMSNDVEIMDYLPNKGLTVYKDEPLKIYGRYKGSGKLTMKLTGKLGDQHFEQIYHFNCSNDMNKSISLLWASRQINDLLNRIRLYGETEATKNEVINLSKQFSIPTPYTSYLVSDDSQVDYNNAGSPVLSQKTTNQPAASPSMQTGKSNVVQSKQMNMMSQARQAEEAEELMQEAREGSDYRLIKGKRFIWNEEKEAWIDEDFREENVITVEKYSDDYFDLIRENKTLVDYMQLTGDIYISIETTNYIFRE
ncbi:MAG: VIT domain-containing protein [Thermotogota bacterium]